MTEPGITPTPQIATPEPDLITRQSQVKVEPKAAPVTEPEFDFKEIDSITDPVQKEVVLKAYKSFQRGFNEKFQTISSLKKEYETKLTEFSNWTPERVQQLVNDPNFKEAAKVVVGNQTPNGQSDDDQSYLSDGDKQRMKQLEQELINLKGASFQQLKSQQDTSLKVKYANYSSDAVDILTNDMLTGKVQATREHLHKVLDYDSAVQRAYELGKQDRKLEIDEKGASASFSPETRIAPSGEQITPEKGEGDRAFLQRIFSKNLENSRQKK